jgi:hypothetical protein
MIGLEVPIPMIPTARKGISLPVGGLVWYRSFIGRTYTKKIIIIYQYPSDTLIS